MGKPAARISDFHMCPMVTPGVPPIPHVGGPILPPGVPTVLIGGLPAATLGSMCVCTGPPDSIILGSFGVLIGGRPAARMGDSCAHGGMIMAGCPTVLIGEINPPSPGAPIAPFVLAPAINEMVKTANQMPVEQKVVSLQASQLFAAAISGSAFVHVPSTCPDCSKE